MHFLLPLLLLFAQPFWESKLPDKWSDREIDRVLHDSPWAQTVSPSPTLLAYLATARPIEDAQREVRIRTNAPSRDGDGDYSHFVAQNRETHFVLAIPYENLRKLGDAAEDKRFEEETVMVVGRRKWKYSGHFPPTPSDPVLRLVFPREVQMADKKVLFRLYLPGVEFPDREVEFSVKDLIYRGKLEM
jgi:hypothetical protein